MEQLLLGQSRGAGHLHPDNPHSFEWQGRPTILITSGSSGCCLHHVRSGALERQPDTPPRNNVNGRGHAPARRRVPGGGRVAEAFNAGFSLFAAAWPWVDHYPGRAFQAGLLS
ncbi:MAG: hypothetical protein HS113_14320 [Verrucomicrobiales bacterium]|nr:hypothetical protein [Verrucomicrobiales bacterium]